MKYLKYKRSFNQITGITLISLVITIIVLLILAGVTIVSIKNSGLFNNAKRASKEYNISSEKEKLSIKISNLSIDIQKDEGRQIKLSDLFYWTDSSSKYYDKDITSVTQIDDNNVEVQIDGFKFKVDNKINITYIGDGEQLIGNNVKTGLISDTEYKINNTTLTFGKIVRVGANEECTTVKSAFDYLCDNGYKDNGAILLDAGTYDTRDFYSGYSYNINSKYNEMKVSIIADEPGKVFVMPGEMGMTEINSSYLIELKYYRVVFTNNAYDYLCLNLDKIQKEYYNCVFLSSVGGWNGIIGNSSINVNNCLFVGGANGFYSSYPLQGTATNCASINTVIDPCNGTKTTCLTNVTYNSSTYQITSSGWEHAGTGTNPDGTQANIGVYGGKYSW